MFEFFKEFDEEIYNENSNEVEFNMWKYSDLYYKKSVIYKFYILENFFKEISKFLSISIRVINVTLES